MFAEFHRVAIIGLISVAFFSAGPDASAKQPKSKGLSADECQFDNRFNVYTDSDFKNSLQLASRIAKPHTGGEDGKGSQGAPPAGSGEVNAQHDSASASGVGPAAPEMITFSANILKRRDE